MKNFHRKNPLFSLCGLNCGLCSMHLGGHCGGCGFGNQSCPLARCSLEHGAVEYCFQCTEYPCKKYEQIDAYDSFITHQRRKSDLQKAQQGGIAPYNAEQESKAEMLAFLLEQYNDGRSKTLFCLAVNLLEAAEIKEIIRQADAKTQGLPVRERAACISALFRECAEKKGITLKLRKRTGGASGGRL